MEDVGDICQHDVSFLTSAPWDRLLFLKVGEGSADRRGIRSPFFNCSPEGDFGTVHTGATSEKTTRSVNNRVYNSEKEKHLEGSDLYSWFV